MYQSDKHEWDLVKFPVSSRVGTKKKGEKRSKNANLRCKIAPEQGILYETIFKGRLHKCGFQTNFVMRLEGKEEAKRKKN